MRFIVFVLLAVVLAFSIFLLTSGTTYNIAGWTLLGLVIAYLIFSFGQVDGAKGEVAALYIFGKPVKNLKPGLYFAPSLITSIRKEKGTVSQDELPSSPENIYRGDDLPPAGKFPPIRVKFGPPSDSKLAGGPYDIEGVEEVVPVVAWKIVDLVKFALVVGDNANCLQMLSGIVVEIIGKLLADKTPAKASQELDAINKEIVKGVKEQTIGWGIEINQAYMKPFIYSHSLNKAVESVSLAEEAAKATVIEAEASKKKRVLEAEGSAKAVELTATAEKMRLVTTGLAKVDTAGNITELVPDANTKANADAIAALAKVTGTLVLGRETATPVINVQKKEG